MLQQQGSSGSSISLAHVFSLGRPTPIFLPYGQGTDGRGCSEQRRDWCLFLRNVLLRGVWLLCTQQYFFHVSPFVAVSSLATPGMSCTQGAYAKVLEGHALRLKACELVLRFVIARSQECDVVIVFCCSSWSLCFWSLDLEALVQACISCVWQCSTLMSGTYTVTHSAQSSCCMFLEALMSCCDITGAKRVEISLSGVLFVYRMIFRDFWQGLCLFLWKLAWMGDFMA